MDYQKKIKTRYSYGLIFCRRNEQNKLQILLVKKHNTYHFVEFVLGFYKKSDQNSLIKLFNRMSVAEKLDILSMKYQIMWYRVFHENPDHLESQRGKRFNTYIKSKEKFDKSFIKDSGQFLRKMIEGSNSCEPHWEVPKGRAEQNETPQESALREFCEETTLTCENIDPLWSLKPYTESFIDCGVKYINIYYYARCRGNPVIKSGFKYDISKEIAGCKWIDMNKNAVESLFMDKAATERLCAMFNKIAKKIKKYIIYSTDVEKP